ncbi:MAG: molybdenum cofactor biosynthesis protein MoaE [Thermoguttaceae bacterium]
MTVLASIHAGPLNHPLRPFPCDGAGAVVRFEGIVRSAENGRTIRGLSYEAYEPMACDMLVTIGEELVQAYGLVGLCVEHSKGLVLVGECSFRLQVASRHRREALAAMGEFIDRLKRDVPIWKTAVE